MSHYLPNNPNLRRALALWAVLAVAVCVKTLVLGGEHSVYPQFAGGSRHWWADMSLYADYMTTENMDGYRYSPAFAIAFTPFYLLPDRLGLIAWNLLSMGLLAWALHVLVRDVFTGPAWHTAEGTFLTLTLAGSAVGIWSGQSNAILPALIALGLAAIVRQRWWTASLLLAVPVFIKIWPIAIVLLLMACWPRQLIGRFAAACAALTLIPFLTRPPSVVLWQYQEWYLALTGPFQGRWAGYRDAWTIWEQLGPMLGRQADWNNTAQHHVYMAMQLLTALVVLGWCLWQRRRAPSTGRLLMLIFSMWAAWQLLFGPGTEQLTYGIIAPATSWAVLVCFAEKKARWLTITAWAMLALLPAGDVEKTTVSVFPSGKLLLPLGVVFFITWLVWHERGTAIDAQETNVGFFNGLRSPRLLPKIILRSTKMPMFQDLTDVYEAMIDWPKRLAHEGPFYRRLFEQQGAGSVVDVACGVGRHAAMFHSWNLRVEGADISVPMIDRARTAFGEPAGLRWTVRGFDQSIGPAEPFDAAVCVGNSLPLAPDLATVGLAIEQMLAAVRSGGLLVVHVLNLWRLPDGPCVWQKCCRRSLPQGEALIVKGVHRCGVRGYVELIVAKIDDEGPIPKVSPLPKREGICFGSMQTESVPFLGLESAELEAMVRAAGAAEVHFFGGYQNQPYDRRESVDLLMVAMKR